MKGRLEEEKRTLFFESVFPAERLRDLICLRRDSNTYGRHHHGRRNRRSAYPERHNGKPRVTGPRDRFRFADSISRQ